MKPSRKQRAAFKAAIKALYALFEALPEGSAKDDAERACDELLTQRYGSVSPLAPA
jgi:hypothetical protein